MRHGSTGPGPARRRSVLVGVVAALVVLMVAGVVAATRTVASAPRPVGAVTNATPAQPLTPAQAAPPAPASSAPAAAAAGPTQPPARPPVRSVVGLGDSVPAGTACDCDTYVTLVGRAIAEAQGSPVTVTNDAVPGQQSGELLASLQSDESVVAAVRGADVVIVTIGANDLTYEEPDAGQCDARDCYGGQVAVMADDVDQALQRIRALAGPDVPVVLTGYWNVWEDGEVGRSNGQRYVRTSRQVTEQANAALAQVAATDKVRFADLWTTFGVDQGADLTSLLAPDGDHPNAAGHRLIAKEVLAQLRDLLPDD